MPCHQIPRVCQDVREAQDGSIEGKLFAAVRRIVEERKLHGLSIFDDPGLFDDFVNRVRKSAIFLSDAATGDIQQLLQDVLLE